VQLVATAVGNYLPKSTEWVERGEPMSALTTRHPKDVQTIPTGQCAYIGFSPNLQMQRKVKAHSYLLNMTPCCQFMTRSIGQHVYKTAWPSRTSTQHLVHPVQVSSVSSFTGHRTTRSTLFQITHHVSFNLHHQPLLPNRKHRCILHPREIGPVHCKRK
jgi:hypothetical protein